MNLEQKVDELFSLWTAHPGAGGQLVIVHKGKTILERCYGYADIEKRIPMTQESVFAVASVTKQITAMSIMILHDRGVLDIHEDIRRYIPDLVNFPQPVTVSHLLHHTSGLRESYELWYLHDKKGKQLNQKNLIPLVARQTDLNFAPGAEFTYCNAGYLLLAEIVERLSGMTLNDFARENIFKPLGMEHTVFGDSPAREIPNRVISYHDDGWRYFKAEENNYAYGSGGLRSTCRDFVKFMPQYVQPTLLSRETMERESLYIPPLADGTVTNYACGVRINQLEGHRYIHHGGVTAAFRTFTVIFPEDELVIAVYTNTYNIPIETAGRDIARLVLGLPPRKKANLDEYAPQAVSEIPGAYYSESRGKLYEIRLTNGEVQVNYLDKWVKLQSVGGNLYKMGRRDITFAFGENPAVNQEGSVQKLRKLTLQSAPETARSYTGSYYSEEVDGTFAVSLRDGSLWLTHGQEQQRLYWLEGETFAYGSMKNKRQIAFCRDTVGAVTGFVHKTLQTRYMRFEKVNPCLK